MPVENEGLKIDNRQESLVKRESTRVRAILTITFTHQTAMDHTRSIAI